MREFWFQFLPILLPLVLIGLGWAVGTWRERAHLASLAVREQAAADVRVTNLRCVPGDRDVVEGRFVCGDVVIASDYFKTVAAALRNLVGGEVRAFETLMERARREALLRMIDDARRLGSREIYNVRFETANILSGNPNRRNKASVAVEVFAFGTAVVRGESREAGTIP
ncbi:MAG: YbjQ family protein [Phycisphaerales bacterium]|nr:MAG: YbjQ family protein [Phycisphaerales bacterium]